MVDVYGACSDIYDPVLGSDGVVYDNSCLANAAGATVVGKPLGGAGFGDVGGLSTGTAVLLGLGAAGLIWFGVRKFGHKRPAKRRR